MFLAAAVLGACAGTGPDAKLAAVEQRLTDEEIVRLLPEGTPASAVRELLGPPTREYALFPEDIETWEYRLAGFLHPRTLYVQLSAGAPGEGGVRARAPRRNIAGPFAASLTSLSALLVGGMPSPGRSAGCAHALKNLIPRIDSLSFFWRCPVAAVDICFRRVPYIDPAICRGGATSCSAGSLARA